jgi:hypothetical protein
MVRSADTCLRYCLLTDIFMHAQYYIYQLLNPCETFRLFLSLLQCNVGVFMPGCVARSVFTLLGMPFR